MSNSQMIHFFYEKVAFVQGYSNYLILLFFIIKPSKIKLKPFYFFFINNLIGIIFDSISLLLHSNSTKQIEESFNGFIFPFYAVNNILFIGLFLAFYADVKIRKYLQISTFIIPCIILLVYYQNNFFSWSTSGSLIQSFTMIGYLIFGFKNIYVTPRNIPNKKSLLFIILGLLLAFSLSLSINIFYKNLIDESLSLSNLFYGIKNIFWIISNLLSAYAIYKIVVKPTSSPKPSPPLPKLN